MYVRLFGQTESSGDVPIRPNRENACISGHLCKLRAEYDGNKNARSTQEGTNV